MQSTFAKLFHEHPAKVDETYFEHMGAALGFAFWLTLAGMAALVHAIVPAWCERTASDIIIRLHGRMAKRR